ncbi:Glycosyl transferase family 17 [Arabidopsis thaliana x Arabidopsis arenosa]|nr:Glycosyl transferase family 17 [Arabidopsis thaliana x Arabidopsis arenosa]
MVIVVGVFDLADSGTVFSIYRLCCFLRGVDMESYVFLLVIVPTFVLADLLIMSDVDEIPSRHTVNLLRWCNEITQIPHLRLKNSLYSFEFLLDNKSWRASVHRFQMGKTRYAHYPLSI